MAMSLKDAIKATIAGNAIPEVKERAPRGQNLKVNESLRNAMIELRNAKK